MENELTCLLVLDHLHNQEYFISIIGMKETPLRYTIIKDRRHRHDPIIKTTESVFEFIKEGPKKPAINKGYKMWYDEAEDLKAQQIDGILKEIRRHQYLYSRMGRRYY